MKTPADVLELGQHLVRELNLDDSVDTLGRWMAHHIAELISEAANGTSAKSRVAARKRAMDAILRIWEHRESLPGYAYPLARYSDLMTILDRLRPDDNPFRFGQISDSKTDQSAAILFDNLTRLIIALLLMNVDSFKKPLPSDAIAVEALEEDEKRVWNAFVAWGNLFGPPAKRSGRRRKNKNEQSAEISLMDAALQLIDAISKRLVELRHVLREQTKKTR